MTNMDSELLIGHWGAIRRGLDATNLEPVSYDTEDSFELRDDGVAHYRFATTTEIKESERDQTWELIGEVLVFRFPIEPMPEYGIEEWGVEEVRFAISSTDENTLLLDSRPFGGEAITEYLKRAQRF